MNTARDGMVLGPADPAPQFPRWPVGWYAVARGSELGRGTILTRQLADGEAVLFRDEHNRVVAVAAHCPHMGAHLRHGMVVGGAVRCPMHHWHIDGEGNARRDGEICGATRRWIVEEACGLVFVWLGVETPGPLPIPEHASETTWRTGGPVAVATPWFTLIISGFDMEHLQSVHGRRVVGEPHIEESTNRTLRLQYRSMVTGRTMADRLMAWLGRDGIAVSMTCSGTVFTVDTVMGGRSTRAILGLLPVGDGVHAYGSFGVSSESWLPRLQARIAAWLFVSFLRKDFAIIEGTNLRTDVRDAGVRAMVAFLRGLPAATDA
ncbi:MAG: Rieske 2Fe-2S domain-containing protein [Gemmatimonadaceae bacterium]|nr:Rieske 2Fe-2S domain-containing protein [Gemmatimonadaceae bacterium]